MLRNSLNFSNVDEIGSSCLSSLELPRLLDGSTSFKTKTFSVHVVIVMFIKIYGRYYDLINCSNLRWFSVRPIHSAYTPLWLPWCKHYPERCWFQGNPFIIRRQRYLCTFIMMADAEVTYEVHSVQEVCCIH